jgi:hypothetical protein
MSFVSGKLTVLFDDPFWVGVFERSDESGYAVARVVFGAEPSDAELYAVINQRYRELDYGKPQTGGSVEERRVNFKRRQREARRTLRQQGVGTKAQQAMQHEYERRKSERQQVSREEKEREQAERFRLRQEKKKQKHRGH